MGIGSLPKTVTLDGFPTFYQAVIRKRGNKMKEIWKPVVGYEDYYSISNTGRVLSVPRKGTKGGIIKPIVDRKGYLYVNLRKQGTRKIGKVHRIVAKAFIPNPQSLPEVNHKDENKKNNNVSNLEWCTSEYNHNYGTRNARTAKANTNGKHCKPIMATLKDGTIEYYSSAREASDALGVKNGSHITAVVKGKRKTAYGRMWRYAE